MQRFNFILKADLILHLTFFKIIFQCCDYHKLYSSHLHFIGEEAETEEYNLAKLPVCSTRGDSPSKKNKYQLYYVNVQ